MNHITVLFTKVLFGISSQKNAIVHNITITVSVNSVSKTFFKKLIPSTPARGCLLPVAEVRISYGCHQVWPKKRSDIAN